MLISPQYDRKLWIFDFVTHEVAENHVGNHLCSTFHKCFLSLMSCESCSQNTAEKCWNYWYCKASLDQERTTTFFRLFFHSFGDFFLLYLRFSDLLFFFNLTEANQTVLLLSICEYRKKEFQEEFSSPLQLTFTFVCKK